MKRKMTKKERYRMNKEFRKQGIKTVTVDVPSTARGFTIKFPATAGNVEFWQRLINDEAIKPARNKARKEAKKRRKAKAAREAARTPG